MTALMHAIVGNLAGAAESLETLRKQGRWEEVVLLLRARISPELRAQPLALEQASREAVRELGDALFMSRRREEAVRLLLGEAERATTSAWRETLLRKARVFGRQFYTNVTFQLSEEGNQAIRVGKPSVAIEKFGQVLAAEKDHVEALLRLGQLRALARDVDSASETLQQVVQLDPRDEEANLWLAYALAERGEKDRAHALLKDRKTMPRKSPEYLLAFRLGGDRRDLRLGELAREAERKSAQNASTSVSDRLLIQLTDAIANEISASKSE